MLLLLMIVVAISYLDDETGLAAEIWLLYHGMININKPMFYQLLPLSLSSTAKIAIAVAVGTQLLLLLFDDETADRRFANVVVAHDRCCYLLFGQRNWTGGRDLVVVSRHDTLQLVLATSSWSKQY